MGILVLTIASLLSQGAIFRHQNRPHKVTLTWTASTSSGVTGYNVYRNGTVIGSTAGTTYADAAVQANQTYIYRVTAVASGQESEASNTFSARIP